MNIKRLILIIFVATPSVALANPSPVAGSYGPLIGLFSEAVLIALVLGLKGYDPVRLFYGWSGVTTATFLMFFMGFYAADRLGQFIPLGAGLALFFLAEAAIVVVEALVLYRMTGLSFFQRKRKVSLDFWTALSVSLTVNVLSFLFAL